MRHTSTRDLFAHWNDRRGERPAPERGDIDPVAIRHALGDVFILAVDFVDEQRFRLAGTRVCALFNRELKGETFGALWDEASRRLIQELLATAGKENIGAVARVTGRTADGTTIDLELLILPLAHQGHARVRALGVLAPFEAPYWLGEKPLVSLELGQVRRLGPTVEEPGRRFFTTVPAVMTEGQSISPENIAARQDNMTEGQVKVRRGLMIYQGGRTPSNSEKAG